LRPPGQLETSLVSITTESRSKQLKALHHTASRSNRAAFTGRRGAAALSAEQSLKISSAFLRDCGEMAKAFDTDADEHATPCKPGAISEVRFSKPGKCKFSSSVSLFVAIL